MNQEYGTGLGVDSLANEADMMKQIMRSLLSEVRTSLPVQVVSVTNNGQVSNIGYVSIRPLVASMTNDQVAIPHGVIHNVPYCRMQAGQNAIIMDPKVGDIGIASFCDRDISLVKANKRADAAGSFRKFDMSDAIYQYTVISVNPPTQYIRFHDAGIDIKTAKLTINGEVAQSGGDVSVATNLTSNTVNATTQLTLAGKDAGLHTHIDSMSGTTSTPHYP